MRVLIISGQISLQHLLGATVGPEIQVRVEPDATAAMRIIECDETDAVVVDLDPRFAPLEGQLALLARIRGRNLPLFVLIDDDSRSLAIELMEQGVDDFFRKPPLPAEFKLTLRRAHEQAQLRKELAERRAVQVEFHCDGLIGQSSKMRSIYSLIRRVADLDSGILVTGESGTGKELIVRAIHNLGSRANMPFVAVSCGAIPETLIESELFGHEKGAFTGAGAARHGLLEMAGEGTLFLDEIGELSQMTQVKLLRVLQQREFTRLGGNKPIPLRARVIFATHRDLKAMVETGQFRQDLYFRINVMTIHAPALRDRRDDIPLLARHMLNSFSSHCKKRVSHIEDSALQALSAYDWPGNVRELENVIHRAVIVAEGDTIGWSDLPEHVQEAEPAEKCETADSSSSFEQLVWQFRRRLARQTIAECHGNKTAAANVLQISRAYLHRLVRDSASEEVA